MSAFVVDTNVPVVANARSAQTDPDCILSCIGILREIRERGIFVLDDAMRILDEYRRNLSLSGQPGAGDFFMKWVWTVQADPRHCQRVSITPRADDPSTFVEFPNDTDLANFDPSDRKFVAVALASGSAPENLDAVDSDWANHFDRLTRNGVRLRFLCPQHVSPKE